MKFSESWLREWVNPDLTREQLCDKLTMAGLEIESAAPVSGQFSGVVIGQVISVNKHPEADRLQVCEVDVGSSKPLTIVCGAANVAPHMKVPAALENAVLPNDVKIKLAKVRGVTSQGMLCSARELGLAEESEGLLVLPQHAPIGQDLRNYLQLDDYVIDVSITPNRGDCLSIMGMAKEVAALTESVPPLRSVPEVNSTVEDVLPVTIHVNQDCPRYVGRIIRKVNAAAFTPIEMQERLRRGGVRCISPIVDVMNYVMLELGQPMHAFSLDKIDKSIDVRLAKSGESLALLDGSHVELASNTMVIADQSKPLAIAGVMGGLDSAVTVQTQDIFLESAYFKASSIALSARHYGIGSDSSYRFERGIDPTMQRLAIERATELLLDIVGGQPGPVIEVCYPEDLPEPITIDLRANQVTKMLGCVIPNVEIEEMLERLGFSCKQNASGWQVLVPARRSDITIEVDLIEEIARLYGYDNIPCRNPSATLSIHPYPETKLLLGTLRRALCDLGYQEVVTYSFIDKKLQAMFEPAMAAKEVLNPITSDMAVMRTNLWPGLVNVLLYNQNRQQSRVRIVESGLRFIQDGDGLKQERTLSGLVCGTAFPEQWGVAGRQVDFYDLKGDLQNLFKLTLDLDDFTFKIGSHTALHPGQTAEIYRGDEVVGVVGALHPAIMQALKIEGKVFVFELLLDKLDKIKLPRFVSLSKFPEIRRDIAILVDRSVPSQAIQDTIREVTSELLKQVDIFDVYQGKGIDPGRKSIALALTLQHSSRTLVDEEIAEQVERVIVALKGRYNAELRG